jgi:hypothetical protein
MPQTPVTGMSIPGRTQMVSLIAPSRRLTRLATVIAAIVITMATTLIVAAPAQAASDSWGNGYLRLSNTCSGLGFSNRIRNEEITSGIWLRVYYSSSQGGTNCANLINNSGRSRNLRIYLSFPDADAGGAWDQGRYSRYAGSVLLKGTSGICIDLFNVVDGREYNRENVHCG